MLTHCDYPGCDAETTAMNPQFHIQIPRTSSNKCHVVVSVTQFYETVSDSRKKKPLFAIGFAVYEVPHATARLTPHFVAEQVLKTLHLYCNVLRDPKYIKKGKWAVSKFLSSDPIRFRLQSAVEM